MKTKLVRLVNNLPLRKKIVFIIFFVNALLFAMVGVVGLQVITKENNKLLYSATATALSYSAKEVQSALDEVEKMSQLIVTDPTVQAHLSALQISNDVQTRSNAFRQLNTVLQTYRSQFSTSDIDYIGLYSDSMTLFTDTARAQKLSGQSQQSIVQQGLDADGAPVWVQDYCPENGLFLSRAVRRIEPMRLDTLGVVNICVSLDKIVRNRTDVSARYDETYYLILDGERPLYTTGTPSDRIYEQVLQVPPDGYGVIKLDGHRYFAVRGTIPHYGWQYVNLVSYDATHRAIQLSNWMFFAVMLSCLVVSILLCNLLVNRITKHIDSLIVKMKQFGNSETKLVPTTYDYSIREDEIGLLHRQFDRMATKIISYIQIDYTNKLMMKDAQIKALEAQIDPHFLYNVLASINWRAKSIGETKISDMVEALSKLLRTTLSNSDDWFTLKNEIELVKNYMTIQQIRFEDELCFQLSAPEELLDASIPKLTIQPLVENAIRHALEESTEACSVFVEANKENDLLRIYVRNTGSQFEEDILENLLKNKVKAQGFGIGIVNIQKRLQLTFGEQYGLRFYNEDDMAVVCMEVPYQPTTDKEGL